jgi:DNA-binding ferritin-like protein (Dps family)
MNFWDTITGSDMTRDWKTFDARATALPPDYQDAWNQIKIQLFGYGSFTGRNLTPIADGALGLLEETASEGQSVQEAIGDDIKGFCAALAGGEGARSYREQWRDQLNRNVARKLSRLGD